METVAFIASVSLDVINEHAYTAISSSLICPGKSDTVPLNTIDVSLRHYSIEVYLEELPRDLEKPQSSLFYSCLQAIYGFS